jgi:aspartyl/asparaginyl-tRNA synthetase
VVIFIGIVMAKKKKVITKTKRNVEIDTESILVFCEDILNILDKLDIEKKYDFVTAIVGLETIGRNISRVMGLDEDARKAILQTADPIINKVVEFFQIESEDKVTVTSIQKMDSEGFLNPIYVHDIETDEKAHSLEQTTPKKPMSKKARVRVGSPIFFMNELGRSRY